MAIPSNLETVLSKFLFDTCVKHGFCLTHDRKSHLLAQPGFNATTFVNRLMLAAGMSPTERAERFEALHSDLIARLARRQGNVA
ncbi:hypothetical protein [Pseudoruegeria sp. HB172150]|uniref:hypothetical protein n=1 Tax=Pseudoruegeria sp. HB172150 TaxID=2721164 RepID=UPI00155453B4|nr:hypothetical protein [Pseudoruegeria sp. HB172150]